MSDTVTINVRDMTVPIGNNINIAVINQPNPVENYAATAQEVYYLIQIPKYDIRESATNTPISGVNYYKYFPKGGGGGGTPPVLIEKMITENGVYDASSDDADGYSEVTANVANTYTEEDNGKVVNDGVLVAQGSDTVHDNGVVDTTLISSLTVDVSGGVTPVSKDVKFYDYDGTIVYSYTPEEFAALESLPDNPTHEGLSPQGWNWSLSDAKTYVATYGKLDIGQMYVTSDGKTRFYITLTEGRTSPILKLNLASGSEVDVDWGDGSTHDTLSGSAGDKSTPRHDYASAGSYVIAISVNSGSITIPQYVLGNGDSAPFSPDRGYMTAIKKVEIGNSVTSINNNAFQNFSSLSSVTIPSTVTSIGSNAFSFCYALSFIIIPNNVTIIDGNAFQGCYALSSIIIPNSVTNIGTYAFQNCSSLSSVTIPSSVTNIDTYAFSYCYALSSVTIPNSVTIIGKNSFQSCYSLSSVTIPSNVTSIGAYTFQGCYALSSIIIPSNVTSIDSYAFGNCYSLATITILGKSSSDISGAPWGATTGSPTYTQVIWENDQ